MNESEPRKKSRDTNKPVDDVAWGNVDLDEGDDVTLAPIDPHTTAARSRMRDTERPQLTPEVSEEPEVSFQFTIKHLLIANTLIAVVFGLMQVFAPSGMAGFLGVTTFLSGLFLIVYRPESRALQLAWVSLLAIYALVCIFAIIW